MKVCICNNIDCSQVKKAATKAVEENTSFSRFCKDSGCCTKCGICANYAREIWDETVSSIVKIDDYAPQLEDTTSSTSGSGTVLQDISTAEQYMQSVLEQMSLMPVEVYSLRSDEIDENGLPILKPVLKKPTTKPKTIVKPKVIEKPVGRFGRVVRLILQPFKSLAALIKPKVIEARIILRLKRRRYRIKFRKMLKRIGWWFITKSGE